MSQKKILQFPDNLILKIDEITKNDCDCYTK